MIKRVTTFVAAMLIALGVSGVATAHHVDTIKTIKDRGTLLVGVAEARPMNVRDPATGEWSGFNIEMARDLAATLGVKLELVNAGYQTLIPGLLTGKYEIAMAQLFANSKRAQVVGFTKFYSTSGLKIAVRQDSTFKTWEELNDPGVTFAVIAGTQDEAVVKKTFPNAKLNSLVTENTYNTFLEVSTERADATMTDIGSIKIMLKTNPKMKLKFLQEERVANLTGRAYAVRKDDWHWLNFLNVWMSQTTNKYEHLFLKGELK